MFGKKINSRWFLLVLPVFLLAGIGYVFFGQATPSQAHCDSATGPVATAAQHALEAGDVDLVLPYVQPEAEIELASAFDQAVGVRVLGGEAQVLADRFFIETAIRLHRMGEGAPYTGVTEEETPPAIQAADQAMASGELDEVYELLNEAIQEGVQAKYEAVIEAREHADEVNTVEANRERVEAELMFEKYVYELFTSATTETLHEGGHTE